jgi:hypothetical protein
MGQSIMNAWRSAVAKNAWVAFLLLFAFRAIAGTALCELYGEHTVPPGLAHSIEERSHAPSTAIGMHATQGVSPAEQPSHDGADQVCDEPKFLTSESTSPPITKSLQALDLNSCLHSRAQDLGPEVLPIGVPKLRLEHPPPSLPPLDVSPRLRI